MSSRRWLLHRESVDLSNASGTRAIVTQEGAAVLHGQVRLNSSHLALDGLALDNTAGTGAGADCVRIQTVGGTDIAITDSDIGSCARDAIRMAYNRGRHDTAVTIAGNNLHDAVWNACTCYMRGGLFMDNLVENITTTRWISGATRTSSVTTRFATSSRARRPITTMSCRRGRSRTTLPPATR